jgi:hypothetical protein
MWEHTSPNYKPLFSLLGQVAELIGAEIDAVEETILNQLNGRR